MGERQCPKCKAAPATRRYSPAEWAGFYVVVCETCLKAMQDERRDAMNGIHAPKKQEAKS